MDCNTLIIVKGKPCKYTTYLKSHLAKLEASVYSPKGINCTIFENQLVSTKIEEYYSKQGKLETKSMKISRQGTVYMSIGYS